MLLQKYNIGSRGRNVKLERIPKPASIALTGKPHQRTLSWEAAEPRLAGITHAGAARGYSYTRTPEDRLLALTETAPGHNRTWQYAYDAAARLYSADRDDGLQYDYGLDAGDNLELVIGPDSPGTWVHDAGNRIAQSPFEYDANGNRTRDARHTYAWDAENRLIEIGYLAEPQRRTQFRYDGLGRRVATVETDAAGSAETRYTWCEGRICLASDASGQALAGYFEEGAFYPQGAPAGALTGRREYYARDHLGSVRDVLDENGHVTARYDYDPYGGWLTPPASAPHAGYAGMDYHAPSGLYLTHYRAYDPETGRWLSRDPIEEAGGINLYAYVEGDPVNWVDLEGLEPGKGERGYSGSPGGTGNPGKHWRDDPNNPGWGWEKDTQTGKKRYKKKPPYIPPPENKSEMCGDACKAGLLVVGVCVVCALQPELCLPVVGAAAAAQ